MAAVLGAAPNSRVLETLAFAAMLHRILLIFSFGRGARTRTQVDFRRWLWRPLQSPLCNTSMYMEQVNRIELSSSAWKAEVLPLNYTCIWREIEELNLCIVINSHSFYHWTNLPNLCAELGSRTLLIFYLLDSKDLRRPFVISNDAIRVIAGLWYPVPESNWCLEIEILKC